MVTDFQSEVYQVCKRVPRGRVTTYKAIAEKLGNRAFRAVGTALNRNPFAPDVPCHRVVNSDGSVGGFAQGVYKKTMMLKTEGISVVDKKIKNFKEIIYRF